MQNATDGCIIDPSIMHDGASAMTYTPEASTHGDEARQRIPLRITKLIVLSFVTNPAPATPNTSTPSRSVAHDAYRSASISHAEVSK